MKTIGRPATLAARSHTIAVVALVGVVAVAGCRSVDVSAAPSSAPSSALRDPDPAIVAAAITTDGLRVHLDALDRIAGEHGGSRGTGTAGDAATAEYVAEVLTAAGFVVSDDTFETPTYLDPDGSELYVPGDVSIGGPPGSVFVDRRDIRDIRALLFSAAAVVEGPVVAIGWYGEARAADGPGCAAEDYDGIPAGAIVLVRPGECLRRTAVEHAQAAGAGALVIAVPWAARGETRQATLIDPRGIDIPVLAATREVGDALAEAAERGGRARVTTTGVTESRTVHSVFAELPGTDPGRVVMVGAHLDSAMNGPGLNDDGSGIAAVLELARAMAGHRPDATIRFAFWAAEETALVGSARYVRALSAAERSRIVAYLNADMLGSPNGIRGVYDEASAALGSAAITERFVADLDAAGLAWESIDTGGSSDQRPFSEAGIPTGGLISGAGGIVTPGQAQRYGTEAGRPPDPCYHLACDDRSNVDETRLLELARSLARVTVGLAMEEAARPSP